MLQGQYAIQSVKCEWELRSHGLAFFTLFPIMAQISGGIGGARLLSDDSDKILASALDILAVILR